MHAHIDRRQHQLQAARARHLTRRIAGYRVLSSIVILLSIGISELFVLDSSEVNHVFEGPAVILGFGLIFGFLIEAKGGARNLIRTDLFMLAALFLLTFLEFLFPQDNLEYQLSLDAAKTGASATLLGFTGVVIGRHVVAPAAPVAYKAYLSGLSPRRIVFFYFAIFAIGFFHVFNSVNFDVFEAVYQMTRPRFSQPWGRGRLGGWEALLIELGLLIYLIPPIAGAVFANWKSYTKGQLTLVLGILAFTMFFGFAGGTRFVILSYLVGFATGYLLQLPTLSLGKMIKLAVPLVVIAGSIIYYMPEIRTVGLSKFDVGISRTDSFFVDMNIVNTARLTEVFPDVHEYLGLEVLYIALIRPIPRAIWPGKPEGLSVGIEEALGVSGMTLSTTFVGEFYLAGGFLVVGIGAFLCGAAASAWNNVGAKTRTNAQIILFASGFFVAGLLMRGFLSVMPTVLPTIAFWLYLRQRR